MYRHETNFFDRVAADAIPYLGRSVDQLFYGNYSDEVTALGTLGQVGTGLLGVDLPGDIRDLSHDFTHWEWTWEHAGKTGLDVLGLLPVIGAIKYVDEVAVLAKGAAKADLAPDVVRLYDVIEIGARRGDAPFSDNIWRQSRPDSATLRKNLGLTRNDGLEAHHIVAGGADRADPARQILNRYQIDINDASNGVALRGPHAPQGIDPPAHRGPLHSKDGYDAVNRRLERAIDGVDDWATGRQRVLNEIDAIRQEILDGTFPPPPR